MLKFAASLLSVLVVTLVSNPRSTAAADAPPKPPAARATVAEVLRAAAAKGSALAESGDAAGARRAYEEAVRQAVGELGAESGVAADLSAAADRAKAAGDDKAAAEALAYAVRSAAADLAFEPRKEADLPKGFPPPGPVGEVVVKDYPAYRAARTSMAAAGQNGAFRVLFNHIQSHDIPMTAPVEMTYRREADGKAAPQGPTTKPTTEPVATKPADGAGDLAPAAMAFLYATTDVGKGGKDGDVDVVDVPALTVVSVGVRGSYTAERMAGALKRVDAWLARHKEYSADGPPRYLGYNSPFNLPWMLYGEVQVPVKKQ